MSYSETEYTLRTLVDRVTAGLVQGSQVRVIPDDSWSSDPIAQPPELRYRVADVAVLGDAILEVTATEIAHVLFTGAADWTFSVKANPEAAQLLFDEMEKARVQRKMGDLYNGTGQVFARYAGEEKPYGAWSDPQVKRDFPLLPVKWRYILNMGRMIRGMSLIGTDSEVECLKEVADDLEQAASASSTQTMMQHLERPFQRLADVIALESETEEFKEYCHKCELDRKPPMTREEWEAAGKPEGPPKPDPGTSDSVSDFVHPPAKEDDGQPGGTDGSPGMRQHGQGLDGPDTHGTESSESPQSGDGGEGEASQRPTPADDDGSSPEQEGSGSGEEGASNLPRRQAPDPDSPPEEAQVKTGNVFRAMVEDLNPGEGGKAAQAFKNYFKKVDREANRVERQIDQENEDHMVRMAQGLGNASGRRTERVRHMVDAGEETIQRVLPDLQPFIIALRQHVKSVLRENKIDTWGGSYRTGRRIKHDKLYRVRTEEEPRIFERRTVLGGKSYCIGIASDQSGSMRRQDKILLAGICTVAALEAFDGLIETACTGFFSQGSRFGEVIKVHYYKRIDEPIKYVRPLLGQLFTTHGGTPMGDGLSGVLDEVKRSIAEVRSIVLISDGIPTHWYKEAFSEAAKNRIPIDAIAIGGIKPFHSEYCRHVVEVLDPSEIVPAYTSLLRRIIHRESAVA